MFGRSLKKSLVLLLTIAFFAMSISVQSSVSATSKIDTSYPPVELQWYVIGNGQQADTDLVLKKVNEYIEPKLYATLKLETFMWGYDFEDKMAAKIASGENFDITFASYWALNYRDWASKGAFVDITDMMDIYAPKTKAILGENLFKGAEVNGKVYGIPTFGTSSADSYGVLLNKKMVAKYKVDTTKIKKLEDLEPTFKKIKASNPKILDFYPFSQNSNFIYSYSIYNTLNYDKLYDANVPGAVKRDGKSTKVVNDFETPEAKSLFNLMNKWYKSGYINKSTYSSDIYFMKNASNIFAFYSTLEPTKCQDISAAYGIDTVPVELSSRTMTTFNSTESMQAISRTSKNPERALMFLELLNTDVYLSNLINYGIEGVHYKKTGNQSISQLTNGLDSYYGLDSYNPGTSWMFGNQSIVYSLPGYSPAITSEKNLRAYINKAVVSPLLGFSFNSKPVLTQLTKFEKITNKYLTNLCIGKVNPSTNLQKMNNEFKNAGLQKVLTEMQKQVDAFVKANY